MGGDYSHHQGAGFGSVTISMSVEEDYYPAVYAYPARFFSFFVVTHPRAHSVTHAWSHSSDQDPPHRFFHLFFLATLLTRRVIPVFQLLDPSKSHINALLYQDRAKFLLFIPSTVINHVLYSKRPFSMLRPVFCHWHSLYGELSRTLSIRRMAIR